MHHGGTPLDEAALATPVGLVRASSMRTVAKELADLQASLSAAIRSISLRSWPAEFPTDIATLRRSPYEARADAIMYRQILAEAASRLGWPVSMYNAKTVEADTASTLGNRARSVPHGPREVLGPPWSKDHRTALAAALLAAN